MTKEDKIIKELKRVNHKIRHEKELLEIRFNTLQYKYDDVQRKNFEAIKHIKDYLCSYDYTSCEFKELPNKFVEFLNILQESKTIANGEKEKEDKIIELIKRINKAI